MKNQEKKRTPEHRSIRLSISKAKEVAYVYLFNARFSCFRIFVSTNARALRKYTSRRCQSNTFCIGFWAISLDAKSYVKNRSNFNWWLTTFWNVALHFPLHAIPFHINHIVHNLIVNPNSVSLFFCVYFWETSDFFLLLLCSSKQTNFFFLRKFIICGGEIHQMIIFFT